MEIKLDKESAAKMVETCDAILAQASVGCADGLGVNRKGDCLLCIAWGETDVPYAAMCRTAEAVRKFFIDQWFGDPEDPHLKESLEEIAKHDWLEGGDLSWAFEIGGLTLRDVCDGTPNNESSHAGLEKGKH